MKLPSRRWSRGAVWITSGLTSGLPWSPTTWCCSPDSNELSRPARDKPAAIGKSGRPELLATRFFLSLLLQHESAGARTAIRLTPPCYTPEKLPFLEPNRSGGEVERDLLLRSSGVEWIRFRDALPSPTAPPAPVGVHSGDWHLPLSFLHIIKAVDPDISWIVHQGLREAAADAVFIATTGKADGNTRA